MHTYVCGMTQDIVTSSGSAEDRFEGLKNQIAEDYYRARSLFTLADEYWREIKNGLYQFDRTVTELSDIFYAHDSLIPDFAEVYANRHRHCQSRVCENIYHRILVVLP